MNKFYLNLVFILNFVVLMSYAQNVEESISIPFGTSLSERTIDVSSLDGSNWMIVNLSSQSLIAKGRGADLLDVVFQEPGSYEISFSFINNHQHTEECFHPSIAEKVRLNVTDKVITYFVEEAKLTKDIRADEDVSGIILSIPVEIKSLSNELVEIPLKVKASGIQTTITGTLDKNQSLLSSGIYTLNYSLSGFAIKDSYISFDFLDFNENSQVFYYLKKIN